VTGGIAKKETGIIYAAEWFAAAKALYFHFFILCNSIEFALCALIT
jgi:hypothetical protein